MDPKQLIDPVERGCDFAGQFGMVNNVPSLSFGVMYIAENGVLLRGEPTHIHSPLLQDIQDLFHRLKTCGVCVCVNWYLISSPIRQFIIDGDVY